MTDVYRELHQQALRNVQGLAGTRLAKRCRTVRLVEGQFTEPAQLAPTMPIARTWR